MFGTFRKNLGESWSYGRFVGRSTLHFVGDVYVAARRGEVGGTAYYYANDPRRHLNANASNKESHAIIDFQAGRDAGLGMFIGTSLASLGIRFAQFTSSRSADINGVPDFLRIGTTDKYGIFKSHHRYLGTAKTAQSFHGVGPSLSWTGEMPLLGQNGDSEISLDWGAAGSVLFGRQKARGEANETGLHYKTKQIIIGANYKGVVSSYYHSHSIGRSRSEVVPNVGGNAGVSWRYSNARVSLGYRADFFFGAVDGGIDTRKTYNQSFYGPFASISIGLGG